MLFEVRGDIFPQGFATDVELALWGLYLTDLNARLKPNG
jgi:hypothetical protein